MSAFGTTLQSRAVPETKDADGLASTLVVLIVPDDAVCGIHPGVLYEYDAGLGESSA